MPIPGLSPQMDSFIRAVYFGQVNVAHYDQFNIRTQAFWHRINVSSTGFQEGQFFDGSTSDPYHTNWPGANGLENDKFMWATHFGFWVEFGTDRDYAAVSNAAMLSRGAATPQHADVESIRKFLGLGLVKGRVGQRVFVDGHSPAMYPGGIGPDVQASASSTVTTMELASAVVQLGRGGPEEAFRFKWPVPIMPNKPVRVSLAHKASYTPSKSFVLGCMIYGVLIEPANY